MNIHDQSSDPPDPMFEALLAEASGGSAPPDFSEQILRALEKAPSAPRAAMRHPVVTPSKSSRGWLARIPCDLPAVASVAVLAALLLVVCTYFISRGLSDPTPMAAVDSADPVPQHRPLEADAAPTGGDEMSPESATDEEPAPPAPEPREVAADGPRPSVVLPSPDFGPAAENSLTGRAPRDAVADEGTEPFDFPPPPARLDDPIIVAKIDQALAESWEEQSLQPAAPASADEIQRRLTELLGQPVTIDSEDAVQTVRRALATPVSQRHVADRLAGALLGRVGGARVAQNQRAEFAQWLAPVVGGEVRFDQAAREILAARGSLDPQRDGFDPAVVWYAALAGPRSVPVVEQFGHAMLDVDLRCGRCHDHPLDGRVWQGQYWQLNALFETGLQWSASESEGLRLESHSVNPGDTDPVVIYELPDGRQRAAYPRIPAPWLFGASDERSTQDALDGMQLDDLARGMIDNPQLARAAVNRVWEVIYGRPLVGSPADPSAAPESAALLRLQSELADQLRAHDFDLSRLLAWVSVSVPMRLSVPEEYQSPTYESATDQQLRLASHSIRCFASYPQSIPRQPVDALMALVDEGLGDSLAPQALLPAGTLLGQFSGDPTANAPLPPRVERSDNDDLVRLKASLDAASSGDLAAMPVEWLSDVGGADGFDHQVEHLYYLAGYAHPSARQMEIAHLIREASESDAAALRRLWWVLSRENR